MNNLLDRLALALQWECGPMVLMSVIQRGPQRVDLVDFIVLLLSLLCFKVIVLDPSCLPRV